MSLFIALAVFCASIDAGYALELVSLPKPGTMVPLSSRFEAPVLKGIKVYRNDPFRFDFIVDKGTSSQSHEQLKIDSHRLVKYFLASLTVPEQDLWVNLSPYEKDRIVPETFGQTEMGRDLLAQDYILKQVTASLMNPNDEVGKAFWKRVYEEAAAKFGTTDIPIDTFNKVWIVPEKATVYENVGEGFKPSHAMAAYVVESKLKVMLDTDYLAQQQEENVGADLVSAHSEISKQILLEVIIPILEKEVNEGKNFAPLRQVYHSLMLATWYKRKLKESLLGKAYVDRQKAGGIAIADKEEKEKIWLQYVEAFKKGAHNFIKQEYDPFTKEIVPRKYYSGGIVYALGAKLKTSNDAMSVSTLGKSLFIVSVGLSLLSAEGADSEIPSTRKNEETYIQNQTVPEIDGQELLNLRLNHGERYRLLRIKGSRVYYVEFATQGIQDMTFDRISTYVESDTHAGQILDDKSLQALIASGANIHGIGHDYSFSNIAAFLTKAEHDKIALNEYETAVIKRDLLKFGILARKSDGTYESNVQGMLISTSQDNQLRAATLAHERRHARYATDEWIRTEVKALWDSISEDEQKKVATAVAALGGWNPGNRDLILTELYANILDPTSRLSRMFSADPGGQFPSISTLSSLEKQLFDMETRWHVRKGMEITPEEADKLLNLFQKGVKDSDKAMTPPDAGKIDYQRLKDYKKMIEDGWNFTYDVQALAEQMKKPVVTDVEKPMQSLVDLPSSEVLENLRKFSERLRNTKAFRAGKVLLNIDQGRFGIHITALNSKMVANLGADPSDGIRKGLRGAHLSGDLHGAYINPTNGRVSVAVYDADDVMINFRARATGEPQKFPIVHAAIANVLAPLSKDEREEWIAAVKQYADFSFGKSEPKELYLLEHTNDVMRNAQLVQTFAVDRAMAPVPAVEIIKPLETIFDWLGYKTDPIPKDATLWWMFGTGSMRSPYELAKKWKTLETKVPIVVMGGIGGSTRTLGQLRQGADLPQPQFVKRVLEEVDRNLDALKQKLDAEPDAFWNYLQKHYDIERGYDARKNDAKWHTKFSSWKIKIFSDLVLSPEESQMTIEEVVIRRLLDKNTRDTIKIPEGLIIEAVFKVAEIPSDSVYISCGSSTTHEQIHKAEAYFKAHQDLNPRKMIVSHETFAQLRAMKNLPFWFNIWHPAWVDKARPEFLSQPTFKYELTEGMDRNYLLYLLDLALNEKGFVDPPMTINVQGTPKTVDIQMPDNVSQAFEQLKELKARVLASGETIPQAYHAAVTSNNSSQNTGGIDLNLQAMALTTKGEREDAFQFDTQVLQRLEQSSGLSPVIIGLEPLQSLPQFLGTAAK